MTRNVDKEAPTSNLNSLSSLYLAWIDISLIANERFMSLIYNILLTNPIRDCAAVCLTDIVKKGMKPLDKLQLIGFLGMVDVLKQVELPVSDRHIFTSSHPIIFWHFLCSNLYSLHMKT